MVQLLADLIFHLVFKRAGLCITQRAISIKTRQISTLDSFKFIQKKMFNTFPEYLYYLPVMSSGTEFGEFMYCPCPKV